MLATKKNWPKHLMSRHYAKYLTFGQFVWYFTKRENFVNHVYISIMYNFPA